MSTDTVNDSENAAMAAEMRSLLGAEVWPLGNSPSVAVLPEGKSLESLKPFLDEYLKKPERRRGAGTATDTASFIALVHRFASAESAIFADANIAGPSLLAVYDYHPQSVESTNADWLQHTTKYAPALSEEWKAWKAKNGTSMSQADFAAFLEERITDVIVPNLDDPDLKTFADLVQGRFADPSQLFGLARGLSVNVETQVRQAVNLPTGEISVVYDENHKDGTGAPISVPNLFQICVPVFYADALYRLAVRLRYRIASGKLTWSYLLVRPDIAFEHAFRGILEKVEKETSSPVFLGTPEK